MKHMPIWMHLLLVSTLLLSACKEVGPYINFEEEVEEEVVTPSFNHTQAQKVVLLEEFTGVRCPNCPAGAILAEQLANQHEGQVIIVSIHSGYFSIPYPNAENFKIVSGVRIESLLGKAAAYPSATINRQLFENENQRIITSAQWNNYIKAELDAPVRASIQLNINNYEPGNLQLTTSIKFFEKIENTVKLTVLLIENDIISPQDVDGIQVDDYAHQHVLRAVLSPFDGVLLGLSAEKDSSYQNKFTFNNFEPLWVENNMRIVAFVHGSGDKLSVLHAVEVALKE